MRILITGALGFMGSHLVKHLSEDNYVIAVDKSIDFKATNRMDGADPRKMNYIGRDLSYDCSGILEDIDVVIHTAANTFVDHSIKDPSTFVKNNIIASYNLFEEARRYKVSKFIVISTDEVYGSINKGYFTEDSKLCPGNPYSATKAAVDCLAHSYFNTYKIPIIILRPENNYGTFQHPQKFIPTIIKKALKDQPVPIYGEGKQRRMWLRVEDFCRAVATAINNGQIGQEYNVGAMQEHENIDIATRVLKILDKPLGLMKFIPDEIARPGHDWRYGISTDKIRTLGWNPIYTIDNSLEEIVNWYKENDWWLR